MELDLQQDTRKLNVIGAEQLFDVVQHLGRHTMLKFGPLLDLHFLLRQGKKETEMNNQVESD